MATFTVEAPFGLLFAAVSPRGLRRLEFVGDLREPPLQRAASDLIEPDSAPMSAAEQAIAAALETQLRDYFAGDRRDFDIPLDLAGGSDFQRRVWQAVATIPFGETLTYADVAAMAGNPSAYRAAGTACGANPVSIVIPCHRVIGSDRRLHGYGGGLDIKAWLLQHEGWAGGSLRGVESS